MTANSATKTIAKRRCSANSKAGYTILKRGTALQQKRIKGNPEAAEKFLKKTGIYS